MTLHLAAAAERARAEAKGDVANTLLWLGDGRRAPPPQMRVAPALPGGHGSREK